MVWMVASDHHLQIFLDLDVLSKHSLPSEVASLKLPARKITNPKESYLWSSLIFLNSGIFSPIVELSEINIKQIIMSAIRLVLPLIVS
jgi:hypothetical protein